MNGTTPIPDESTVESAALAPEPPEFTQAESPGESRPGEMDQEKIAVLDVEIKLNEDQEKEIVGYLKDNLPKMRCSDDEEKRIKAYFAMYDMAISKRTFPYENAPSIASSDAHDKLNEFLDYAEIAFLQQRNVYSIDREDSPYDEATCRRIEKTVHRERFIKNDLISEFRLMLFESAFLGSQYVAIREVYDIEPRRTRVVIKNDDDLQAEMKNLSGPQVDEARKAIVNGRRYLTERDTLKIKNVGPMPVRIDQTKFFYPRNSKKMSEWQLAGEKEFYTKSALRELARRGELRKEKVEEAVQKRKDAYTQYQLRQEEKKKDSGILEDVKPSELDSDWVQDIGEIATMGDAYEDEFCVYRVSMLYNIATRHDPSGALRTWIEVLFCPAGDNVLGAKFCQHGFPYRQAQLRPVPYRCNGAGMAQGRYAHNMLDSDLKSLALASIEQEVGTPLLLRDSSGLFALDFRAYPASVAYTQDVHNDAAFLPMPEKSRLAIQGMSMVLGSSPQSNLGAGYASGKREETLLEERINHIKARIHTLSLDFDGIFNAMWKIDCQMSRLNTEKQKYLPWVFKDQSEVPNGRKLYVLESEMVPDITWTCTASARDLTPDSRLKRALMEKEILHDKVPASVNSPRLTKNWSARIARFFDDIEERDLPDLIPSDQDFAALQQQLGSQGGERPNAPGGAGGENVPRGTVAPMTAQSPATPFRNPAASK